MAVVGSAGALVYICTKGTIKESVIITCVTVFFAKRKQVNRIKTESIRKLSNFSFQWTKNLVPEIIETIGPFIQGNIRRVLNKTQTVPFIRTCII